MQPVSTVDSVIVVGSADELRAVTPFFGRIRNTAAFDIDAVVVLKRASDAAEINLSSPVTVNVNGVEFLGQHLVAPWPLADGDQVLLRVSKTGGGGDVTEGVVAFATWLVLSDLLLDVATVTMDETIKTVGTVPPGVAGECAPFNIGSGLMVCNFDDIGHTFKTYINTGEGGPDILLDSQNLAAGANDGVSMLSTEFNSLCLASGWSIKVQMTEPVSTIAPDARLLMGRRDSAN